MANKVNFGVSTCYYAKATVSGSTVTYATPVALPGCVSISLSQEGGNTDFFADNIRYYRTSANQGYTGTMEFAYLPEGFRKTILGQTEDTNHVFVETNQDAIAPFALIFKVEGDVDDEMKLLYFCEVSRPPINANTITDSTDVDTVTLDITCSPRPDTGEVSASTGSSTATSVISGWTGSVYTG